MVLDLVTIYHEERIHEFICLLNNFFPYIEQVRNYVVENVGSVSTMIAERIKSTGVELTEAEATILALGIHSDTGSLVYDSTVGLLIHCLFGSIIST